MNRRLVYISSIVLFVHLLQFGLLTIFQTDQKKLKPTKIAIVTKTLPPLTPMIQSYPETSSPKAALLSEKEIPPPPPPKKKTPPPAPKKKVAPRKESKKMLKKIDQKLAKVKNTPKKSPPLKAKPSPSKSVEVKGALPHLVEDASSLLYYEEVCAIFETHLLLPEKGMVKLTISVQANGKIAKMDYVAAKSEKNLEYLKNRLPELVLPKSQDGKNVVFTITFCDE